MQPSVAQSAITLFALFSTSVASTQPLATVASQTVVQQETATQSATPLQLQLKQRLDSLEKNSTPSAQPTPTGTAREKIVATIPQAPTSLDIEQITFLGTCESGMTATRNSGNGYYGAFQFSPGHGTGYKQGMKEQISHQLRYKLWL